MKTRIIRKFYSNHKGHVLSVSLLTLFVVPSASAYFLSDPNDDPVSPSGGAVAHWPSNEIAYSLHADGAGDGLTFNDTQSEVVNAVRNWSLVNCSDMSFRYEGLTAARRSNDGVNSVYWIEAGDPEFTGVAPFPSSLYAGEITTTQDGVVIDSDIIFNGRDYDWSGVLSIEGIATHEFGHRLSLEHTNVAGATMLSSISEANSVNWTSLEADDINAICYVQPSFSGASNNASGDFNGDGYDDLAIGVPFEDFGSTINSGSVNIIYGASTGLSSSNEQIWGQNNLIGSLEAEEEDRFGSSIAVGDFNGDGYDDIAVGSPNEDIGSIVGAGQVSIIYGSVSGLTSTGNQVWHQDSSGINESAEENDQFGASLTTGDFDNDGYTDLAVGVPNEDVSGQADAGAVAIIYGSATGLISTGDQLWSQNSSGIGGSSESGDQFGSSLTSGDFDGDGRDDLAIGTPNETIGSSFAAGMVSVIYGSVTGLTSTGSQSWEQNVSGIAGSVEEGDRFGYSLASGDFDNDGRDDLAVGVPSEAVGSVVAAGMVNIIYGSATGLTSSGDQGWDQNDSGILDSSEDNDYFGAALAVGDFNQDGYSDLAVGTPNETLGSISAAGQVSVLYGSSSGVSSLDQVWNQDSSGIEDTVEQNDQFGSSLVTGDFDGDGISDLSVGVPSESVGANVDAGAVNVLYGTTSMLSSSGDQLWHQDVSGISGSAEDNDGFGSSL